MGYRRHNYREDIAGPASVYRIYDDAGALLYVGVSADVERRLTKHRARSWWPDRYTVRSEQYPTRAAAFAAERIAITNENPRYNAARPKVV